MAAALTADNRTTLENRFGRPMEPVDLYLAHFLGTGGAMRFLAGIEADPDQPGATMLPQAAAANRPILDRTRVQSGTRVPVPVGSVRRRINNKKRTHQKQ